MYVNVLWLELDRFCSGYYPRLVSLRGIWIVLDSTCAFSYYPAELIKTYGWLEPTDIRSSQSSVITMVLDVNDLIMLYGAIKRPTV